MKGTTIYFISCVHQLCNLNLNILNWVGLKKITCSSLLQCSILRLGFQVLGCLVHYSINLSLKAGPAFLNHLGVNPAGFELGSKSLAQSST